jgi:hypothetical protein
MALGMSVSSIVARISPAIFEAEFHARRRAWLGPLEAQGCRGQAFAHQTVRDDVLGNRVALPPVLSVGELRLAPERLGELQHRAARQWVATYLRQHSYPALVSWAQATAISFRSLRMAEGDTALIIAQKTLVSVIASLRADLVRVIAIDTVGFGRRAAILRAAVPRLELVTTLEEVQPKLVSVQTTLRDNISAFGLRDVNLGDFNRRNPETAKPFTFVLVGSTTADLPRESHELVRRMVHEDIGVRGGIQFVLVGDGEPTEHEAQLFTPNSPRVVIAGTPKPSHLVLVGDADPGEREAQLSPPIMPRVAIAGSSKTSDRKLLEVVDPSGLDTRDGGAHQPFEVVAALEVDEVERVAASCRRHLEAGRPPTIALPIPPPAMRWKAGSSDGLSVPLGRSATQTVHLTLGGGGLTFNALIGGAVGTGKTVLLHGIICTAAALYSPDELQLSLLDYKEGTEFAIYRSLPHIFALSLGSSSDFGLEVIRALQREMSRRASLYKEAGVQDLAGYRRATGATLPRHLLVIDEFQVLLANRADARDVLEDLIRRGRSAGIHLILASQSLADMSLNTAVLGQLGARICLKLSTSECARFLAPGNESPARFQHPGQAVLNEREGATSANHEFRAANYDIPELRKVVAELAALSPVRTQVLGPPFVYDADAPVSMGAEDRRRLTAADRVMWGLSQELPPRTIVSSLREKETLALVGHGKKVDLLLATLREGAAWSGLALHECTTRDVAAAGATDDVPIVGPVVVTVTDTGFTVESALQALRERLPFLLVVVTRDARTLTAPGLRDDVLCCDEGAVNDLAYRKLPALQNDALVARVRAGVEPALIRLLSR